MYIHEIRTIMETLSSEIHIENKLSGTPRCYRLVPYQKSFKVMGFHQKRLIGSRAVFYFKGVKPRSVLSSPWMQNRHWRKENYSLEVLSLRVIFHVKRPSVFFATSAASTA